MQVSPEKEKEDLVEASVDWEGMGKEKAKKVLVDLFDIVGKGGDKGVLNPVRDVLRRLEDVSFHCPELHSNGGNNPFSPECTYYILKFMKQLLQLTHMCV